MGTQMHPSRDAVQRAPTAQEDVESNELWDRELTRGGGKPEQRAHPLEFDAQGFPIPQSIPGFVRRVGRLTSPA